MTEPHAAHDSHDHGDPRPIYKRVFVVLLIFTILEYAYATWSHAGFLNLVIGLMIMATIKAALVGMYFMHLKYEGTWVYYLLVPAACLATVLIGLLCPDIAFQANIEPPAAAEDEAAITAPAPPNTALTWAR
jgi:cytochrome c oxidase subunit IV